MTSDSRIIYWDTCIFLAWLKNEKRPGVEMAGLVSIANEITKGNFHLITSVTTMAEVLFNRSGKGIADRFKNLFKQSNVDAINIDERIATKAGEIREYYIEASKKDGKPALGFADALHLATAIVQEATVFHTFDDSDKNHRGLLAARGGSTFSELRWYPRVEAAKGSLSWVFRAKQPESVRTGP